jgi:repressor LexA
MDRRLTDRQKQVLDFIVSHNRSRGYPPTVREIGEALGLSSSATVHAHLRRLESLGCLVRGAELNRAITVSQDALSDRPAPSARMLPVVGRVAAGQPILAVEDYEETYPVPGEFLAGAEGFLLRVRGDSMIEDGILDGDMVMVRRQSDAESGDTVVAMVGDEATVKRLYREEGRIKLQPANPEMKPTYHDSVEIVGKVVGLIRKMT